MKTFSFENPQHLLPVESYLQEELQRGVSIAVCQVEGEALQRVIMDAENQRVEFSSLGEADFTPENEETFAIATMMSRLAKVGLEHLFEDETNPHRVPSFTLALQRVEDTGQAPYQGYGNITTLGLREEWVTLTEQQFTLVRPGVITVARSVERPYYLATEPVGITHAALDSLALQGRTTIPSRGLRVGLPA